MPMISVIIATYNRPHTLGGAVRSALAAGGEVEVVVVDDSPAQTGRAVVEALADPRVRYIVNPAPTGGRPAVVRNLGWPLARGDLVHFLDDDDMVPAGYYDQARDAFADGATGVVFGGVEPFGDDDGLVDGERRYFQIARRRALRCARFGVRWGFTAGLMFRPAMLVCGAGMVRRTHLAALRGFDEALLIVEDVDFYMRAIRLAGARFIDATALRYRIGPSLMHSSGKGPTIAQSYQTTFARYRAEHGRAELLALKLLAWAL